jgi:alkylhydroperoxidase family enzyme
LEVDAPVVFSAQVAEDWRNADMPEKDRGMLEYVEKITLAASTITHEEVDHLRHLGWNDREILDIALVSSAYNFWCRMADGLGVELDEGRVDSQLLQEIEHRRIAPKRP